MKKFMLILAAQFAFTGCLFAEAGEFSSKKETAKSAIKPIIIAAAGAIGGALTYKSYEYFQENKKELTVPGVLKTLSRFIKEANEHIDNIAAFLKWAGNCLEAVGEFLENDKVKESPMKATGKLFKQVVDIPQAQTAKI